MKKIVKTWWLEAEDGRRLFVDEYGNYAFENLLGYIGVEFREDEHPDDDKYKWAASISKTVGEPLRLVRGPDWTEDQVSG